MRSAARAIAPVVALLCAAAAEARVAHGHMAGAPCAMILASDGRSAASLACSGAAQPAGLRIELPGGAFCGIESVQAFYRANLKVAAGHFDADGLVDLVVGAPRGDGLEPAAGRVRFYTYVTDPQVYCESQTNSQGCVPRAFWTGTASAAASTLRVHAEEMLNGKVGLLFWAPQPNDVPFGDGTLCIGSPITRTPGQVSGGTVGPDDCTGAFAYQFTSPYLAAQGLVPGSVVHARYWSRDPAAPSALHLTDAVRFSVLP